MADRYRSGDMKVEKRTHGQTHAQTDAHNYTQ